MASFFISCLLSRPISRSTASRRRGRLCGTRQWQGPRRVSIFNYIVAPNYATGLHLRPLFIRDPKCRVTHTPLQHGYGTCSSAAALRSPSSPSMSERSNHTFSVFMICEFAMIYYRILASDSSTTRCPCPIIPLQIKFPGFLIFVGCDFDLN